MNWGVYTTQINEVHIIPQYGYDYEHIIDIICWCVPYLVYKNSENGKEIWSHRYGNN